MELLHLYHILGLVDNDEPHSYKIDRRPVGKKQRSQSRYTSTDKHTHVSISIWIHDGIWLRKCGARSNSAGLCRVLI